MQTRRLILLASTLVMVISGPVYARRGQPIYNAVDPIPPTVRNLALDRIEALIVASGGSNGWTFRHVDPGHLEATYRQKTHVAVVDITFDKDTWRITYKTSLNLAQDGERIHPHYNTWVQKLERNINFRLSTATQ